MRQPERVRTGASCSVGVLMAVGAIVRALAGIVSLVIVSFETAIGDGTAVEFVIAVVVVVVVRASSSMRIGSPVKIGRVSTFYGEVSRRWLKTYLS
jgi:hypothetical protein